MCFLCKFILCLGIPQDWSPPTCPCWPRIGILLRLHELIILAWWEIREKTSHNITQHTYTWSILWLFYPHTYSLYQGFLKLLFPSHWHHKSTSNYVVCGTFWVSNLSHLDSPLSTSVSKWQKSTYLSTTLEPHWAWSPTSLPCQQYLLLTFDISHFIRKRQFWHERIGSQVE